MPSGLRAVKAVVLVRIVGVVPAAGLKGFLRQQDQENGCPSPKGFGRAGLH